MASIKLDPGPAQQLAAKLVQLGDQVTALDAAHADAAALLLAGANPPRRSGQLAAAGRVDVSPNGFVLAYPIRYATFVHWGTSFTRAQPWLVEERDASYSQLADLYAQAVEDNIDSAIK